MPLPAKPSLIARRGGHGSPLRVGVILLALAGAAAHFVYAWGWRRAGAFPFDLYHHYYPNMLRAADVVRDGALVNADEAEIARAQRAQARRFAA